MIRMLSIEIDGHFRGSMDVPRPWVAEIVGTCPRYGLRREFVRPMTDWSEARCAWSGNIYGRVARFPLRDGRLYEVCRARGRSSKRRMVREFLLIDTAGKRVALTSDEALARADGGAEAALYRIPEDKDGTSWIARITGLGTPQRLGFVVVEEERLYRLPSGLYEVQTRDARHFVAVGRELQLVRLTEQEAYSWLASAH